MKIKLFIICTILSFSFQSFAQRGGFEIDSKLSTSKMKARAKYAEQMGDVYTALFYYEEVVKKDSSDIDAFYNLGNIYQSARNYSKAEWAFKKVLDNSASKYPFALYEYGVAQKMQGKYELAKKNLFTFKKEARNLGDKDFKLLLEKEIYGCDSGLTYQEFPDNVIIENMGNGINQPHTEFSPLQTDSNTLIYGSLRMETLSYFDVRNDHREEPVTRQIYKAEKTDGKWENKGLFEPINDPEMEMGNFVYSPTSNKYYFSKCKKNSKGKASCKIYSTENRNGNWTKPVELPDPINLSGYTSTQPAIVYDSATKIETLYFVSDRPRGKGDLDIWSSTFNVRKGEWIQPQNFNQINTPENEVTPYFNIQTQSFFFSSNGHTSAGGYDIYKLKKEKSRFLKMENLSFPINSPADDINFVLNPDGKTGYLVSNRPGTTPYFHETCCDDIFSFKILPPKPFECKLVLKVAYNDTTHSNGTELVKYSKINIKTNIESKDSIRAVNSTIELPLDPNHQYYFKVEKDGFQKDSLGITTREMSSMKILEKTLTLKVIEKKPGYEFLEEKPVEGKAFVLSDIQYGYKEDELNDASIQVLDSLLIPFLKAHPKDKLTVTSHTDSKGSHKYNHSLSQKRADNVVNYLISKGIPKHRLHAIGHGETKPIAPNTNPDGTDNVIGQSFNRRTEFLLSK